MAFSPRFVVALSKIPSDFRPNTPSCIDMLLEAYEADLSSIWEEFNW